MNQPRSLAARAGRWSATHRKKAIWGWLAFVILSFAIGGAVGTRVLQQDELGVGESGRADQTIEGAFPRSAEELVLVQSDTETATDPSFRAAVADLQRRLDAGALRPGFRKPLRGGQQRPDLRRRPLRSGSFQDRRRRHGDGGSSRAGPCSGQRRAGGQPGLHLRRDRRRQRQQIAQRRDQRRLQAGAFHVAADHPADPAARFRRCGGGGVPLLLALTAVLATIGLMGPISQISGVDSSVNEVILLIGLAVGVDYSMFYLRREREERESGRTEEAALAAAAATSGRAVMISGLTVMIAMAGMYLAGASTFQSFATGTILVVAIAVVGSLTVLPATLAWLGDRVEKGGVPIIKDQPWNAGESALWSRILNPVLRHPARFGRGRRGPAGGPVDSRLQASHGEPERQDAAAGPLGDPDLQPDSGGLPGRADPGRRRGQRRRRDLTRGQGRDRGSASTRPPPARTSSSRSRPRSAPTARSPRSASRWPGTAATRNRRRHLPRCETSSFRRLSEACRASPPT